MTWKEFSEKYPYDALNIVSVVRINSTEILIATPNRMFILDTKEDVYNLSVLEFKEI